MLLSLAALMVGTLVGPAFAARRDLGLHPVWEQLLIGIAEVCILGGGALLLASWAAAAFMIPLGGPWLVESRLADWSVAGRRTVDLCQATVGFRYEQRIGDLLVLADPQTDRVISVPLPTTAAVTPGLLALAAALAPRSTDPTVGPAVRYLQERLSDASPGRWAPLPAELRTLESWRETRSTRRFLHALFGVPGLGFLANGLATLIPTVLLAVSSTTVQATVIDDGPGRVRFTLSNGVQQTAELPNPPETLQDGRQITIDYLPADPRIVDIRGSHRELLNGLLFASVGAGLLWSVSRRRRSTVDPFPTVES